MEDKVEGTTEVALDDLIKQQVEEAIEFSLEELSKTDGDFEARIVGFGINGKAVCRYSPRYDTIDEKKLIYAAISEQLKKYGAHYCIHRSCCWISRVPKDSPLVKPSEDSERKEGFLVHAYGKDVNILEIVEYTRDMNDEVIMGARESHIGSNGNLLTEWWKDEPDKS